MNPIENLSNDCVLENSSASIDENNTKVYKDFSRRPRSKLVASFLFLCAAVVVVQTGIYIPLFSDIFAPPPAQVTTFTGPYITGVTTWNTHVTESIGGGAYKDFKYIHIQVSANPEFEHYKSVLVQIYNASTSSIVEHGYGIINKEDLDSFHVAVRFDEDYPVSTYQIKIFCSTDNPEEFEEYDTFVKDEIKYFLIYSHDSLVSI